MTSTNQEVESWFDEAERNGAPSAKLKELNDAVFGEIVDQFTIDYVPFGKTEPAKDERTQQVIKQLVIILQTDQRDWSGVAKIPTDAAGNQKPASADDGRRAVYVRKFTNIYAAVGAAMKAASEEAGEKLKMVNGGKLGVQLFDKEDVGKGNPLSKFRCKYVPPAPRSEADAFFGGNATGSPQSTPPQGQPSTPAQQEAPSSSVAQPATQPQDPWATTQPSEPPF